MGPAQLRLGRYNSICRTQYNPNCTIRRVQIQWPLPYLKYTDNYWLYKLAEICFIVIVQKNGDLEKEY